MKITQWLAANQIKLRLVNEEAINKKIKAIEQETEAQLAYPHYRTDFHKEAEMARLQKELNYKRAENLRAIKPKARKEPVKNVDSYNPFLKYEDEYGHLLIYNEHWLEIDRYYCKKPTERNSITHTFDIPANTTVSFAKFISDSGTEMKMSNRLTEQRFHSSGTYTITLNYVP